jgi:hypothetical protein
MCYSVRIFVICFENLKTFGKGVFFVHKMFISFFLLISFQVMFYFGKYLTGFAQDVYRNACMYSYEVSIIFVEF